VALKLSSDQLVALNLIYAPFRDGGPWPDQRYVEKALRPRGLTLDLFKDGPVGLIAPDPARSHFHIRPENTIGLTIAGVSACNGSGDDIDLFLRALQFFVRLEDAYLPPPAGGQPLYAGSNELVNDLGFTFVEAMRVHHLSQYEIGIFGGGGSGDEQWQLELTPDIQRFAGITTIEQYLDVRVVPGPYRPAALVLEEQLLASARAQADLPVGSQTTSRLRCRMPVKQLRGGSD
jgi:hypothetical protein